MAETTQDPDAIFKSVTRCFAGRLDVKVTTGPDDAPLLRAAGKSFAMLLGGELAVRLHPIRVAELIESGKGHEFVHDGQPREDWVVIEGQDGALWTSHTMEALAWVKD